MIHNNNSQDKGFFDSKQRAFAFGQFLAEGGALNTPNNDSGFNLSPMHRNGYFDNEGNFHDRESGLWGVPVLPEVSVTPEKPIGLDKLVQDYSTLSNDATATPLSNNSHLNTQATSGASAHAEWEKEHPYLSTIGNVASATPFMVASVPALATAGELAAPILANPFIDTGVSSAFAAKGLSDIYNGEATALTALDFLPLAKAAKPLYNEAKALISPYREPAYEWGTNSSSITPTTDHTKIIDKARQDMIDFVHSDDYIQRLQRAGLSHRQEHIQNTISNRAAKAKIKPNTNLGKDINGVSSASTFGREYIEYNPNGPHIAQTIDHELAHYTTKNIDYPGLFDYYTDKIRGLFNKESLGHIMEYNRSIAPKNSYHEAFQIKPITHSRYEYLTNASEIRSRAYTTLNDAKRHNMTIDQYLDENNKGQWADNTKELMQIFTPENAKKYLKNFLSISIPIIFAEKINEQSKQQ